ncbi:MAG: hypothetical protein ACK5GZ_08465 [Cyanobium sp.]
MHNFIVGDPQFLRNTKSKPEQAIQTGIRPLIIRFLEMYFSDAGYKDSTGKANKSFNWEGQEGEFGKDRATVFGSRNYPDFIITDPYLVAIEYAQSQNEPSIKRRIGQSMIHTLCRVFDFVYYLIHDQSPEKMIQKSIDREIEADILRLAWNDLNVFVRFA